MPKKKLYPDKKRMRPISFMGYPKERDYIVENMALLIASGIPVSESVSIVSSGLRSKQLKRLLVQVTGDLDEGSPLWKALSGTGFLEDNYINLIKLGEESGRLVENLRMIISQQQKARVFKEKLRVAMTYPGLVFSLMIVIGLLTSWFILPKLMTPFLEMDIQVPLITQVLIGFGKFLQQYGYVFVPTFLTGIFTLIYLIFFHHKTRFIGQAILFRIPGPREIIKESEIARFGFVLSGLLGSGIPITESLVSLGDTSPYRPYQKLYRHLAAKIDEGYTVQKSFQSYKAADKLIPVPIQEMIFAGERSGSLADVLGKISEIYEEKVENSTQNISILIEPILLFVVGVGVLMLALGVILPIYTLVGSVGS